MKKWNKLAAGILAGLVLCSVAAGCGQTGVTEVDAEVVSDVVMPDETASPDIAGTTTTSGEISRALETGSSIYGYRPSSAEYYNLMTQNEETLYNLALANAYTISNEKNESGYYELGKITIWDAELTEDEIKIAITAFKNDHPQIFWIANVYGRAHSDGNTIVQLYSYVSPSECNMMIANLDTAVKNYTAAMNETALPQFDREVKAFQMVADGCVYDTETADDNNQIRRWKSYTAYGALVDGTAVCEGYSRAMQLLLNHVGMECRLVCGEAGGTNHMWNMVKVDEVWYHLDATWNDQQAVILYDYFNVTDAAIEKDHKIAPELNAMTMQEVAEYMEDASTYNFSLPSGDSEEHNYLQNYGIKIDSFTSAEDRRVIEAFKSAAENREPAVYLYISEDIDFDMAVSRIFKAKSPKILSYIKGSNKQYGIPQIDKGEVKYIMNEQMRSITVILTYK